MAKAKNEPPALGDTGEWSGGGLPTDPSFGIADIGEMLAGRPAARALSQPSQGSINIGGVRMPANASIRDQIRQAYFNLTDNAYNQRISLTDIKGQLKHLPQEAVDAELIKMHTDPAEANNLSGAENPRDIDEILRRGAINFKGEPLYYIWINPAPKRR